ncbi:MAG: hypothetical protein HC897_18265 [Thermoanaerobaculia bacterium]|nr:hypothetical protein [Thermoanaerobaculia bacterium]
MSPGQKLPLLLLLWVFPLVTAGAASAAPAVVARWSGGELTRELFQMRYDGEGRALAQGGRALDEALCKAVFQEVYARQAETLGLDRSAELADELAVLGQDARHHLGVIALTRSMVGSDSPRV